MVLDRPFVYMIVDTHANLPLFLQAGVKEVHSSAGQWLPSPMRFRNPGLSMSTDADADEYLRYAVNGEAVAEMKKIIYFLFQKMDSEREHR